MQGIRHLLKVHLILFAYIGNSVTRHGKIARHGGYHTNQIHNTLIVNT